MVDALVLLQMRSQVIINLIGGITMRPRFRTLIVFLLFLSFVNTALSQSDSEANVVFSFKEWTVLEPVVGVEDVR